MGIPARAILHAELHCLSRDGRDVVTAQQWHDPAAPADRPKSWLRLVRNGRIRQDHQFIGKAAQREMNQFWSKCTENFRPTWLVEDQMWVNLRTLAGIEQARCPGCSAGLPVARSTCPQC